MYRRIALIALLLAGCGGDDPTWFTITDSGEGAANSQPLWPLSVGYRAGQRVVDGMVDSRLGPLYRLAGYAELTAELYLVDARGVFYAGSVDEGLRAAPILKVPAVVRSGMKWTVYTDGQADLEYTVEHDPATPTAWTIIAHDPQGTVADYRTSYTEEHYETQAVFLDSAERYPPPPVKHLTLRELPLREAEQYTQSPGMIRVGQGPALLLGTDKEFIRPLCQLVDDGGVRPEIPPDALGPFVITDGPACIISPHCLDLCNNVPSGDAGGVQVAADGKIAWIPRALGGRPLVSGGEAISTDPGAVGSIRAPLFAVAGPDHTPAVVHTYQSGDFPAGYFLDDELFTTHHYEGFPDALLPFWPSAQGFDRIIALPEPNGDTALLMVGFFGEVWTSRLTAALELAPLVDAQTPITGKVSVLATEHGTQVLNVTADGAISQLTVAPGDGGLRIQPLAKVDLPAGEATVGAWRWEDGDAHDRVMVSTLTAGQYIGAVQHLYLSNERLGTLPDPAPSPLEFHVAGQNLGGHDMGVCWPASALAAGEQPAIDTWRSVADGQPPTFIAYRPGASCAFVFGTKRVEGDFPGIGHAVLAGEVGTFHFDPGDVHAALSGGGMVTATSRFDEPRQRYLTDARLYDIGGLPAGRPPLADDLQRTFGADLAGHGIWANTGDGTLVCVGRTSVAASIPASDSPEVVFFVAGGGVVAEDSTNAWWLVAPDGQATAIPAFPALFYPETRLTDGSFCGLAQAVSQGPFTWSCRAPDGHEVTSSPNPDLSLDNVYVTLEDGSRLSVNAKLTLVQHFGKDGVTVFNYPDEGGTITQWETGPDGSQWAVEAYGFSQHRIVRLTPEGIIPQDDLPIGADQSLFVGAQLITIGGIRQLR